MYHEYHDLSYKQTEEVIRKGLHDKSDDNPIMTFSLSNPKERESDSDNLLSEGDLEETLHGP